MKKNRFNYLAPSICLCTSLVAIPVSAEDWTDRVTIKGFLSAVYQQTNQDDAPYEGELLESGITSAGTTQGTQFGLNINAQVNDRLTIVGQLHSARDGEGYVTNLEWGFLSLNLNENFDLRAGRIKFPGGLVSEYVNVGYVYPWIQPPREMYSEDIGAAQAVHESFSGVSLLASTTSGDLTYSANIFTGEIAEDEVLRTDFAGITLEANWDEKVTIQAAYNQSTMETGGVILPMDGQRHDIVQLALKIDWNNIVTYAEWADVNMGDFAFGEAEAAYVTLGYRIGNFLPHVTVSTLEKAQKATGGIMADRPMLPYEQTTSTLGLRWDFMPDIALKVEVSSIELDSIDPNVAGVGLFGEMPDDDRVTRYGLALDAVF